MTRHVTGMELRRGIGVFVTLAATTTVVWLMMRDAPPAAAQSGDGGAERPKWYTGTGAGFYRDGGGSNVPRNAPTRVPPTDCKASAAAFRQQYQSLIQRYNQTRDEDEKHKIREQIQDLQKDWALLQKDCGDQGPLAGGGGAPASGGASPSGAGSPGSAASGAGEGGGGAGGGSASGTGSPAPAPGAPPEPGLAPLLLAELILARPPGSTPPTATGPIHVQGRLAWRDLQNAWSRIGQVRPRGSGETGGGSTSNPVGGALPGAPGSGSPGGGSGGGAPGGGAPPPSSAPVPLPDDATAPDRLGAEALEARRAEAADLNSYAESEERHQQAETARDSAAMLREAEAMLQFADKALADARASAEKQHQYEGRIVDALNAIQATLAEERKSWPKALEEALASVRRSGLPAGLKERLTSASVPASEVDALQSRLASYTPSDVEQGVAELKARYGAAEKVRTGLAARGASTAWPPPPDIEALESARDAARRLKEQAPPGAPAAPAAAPAPAVKPAEPARRTALAGFDPWWLVPAAVVVFLIVLVAYGVRRRARRAARSR